MDGASGHSLAPSDDAWQTDRSAGMHTSPSPPPSYRAEAADRMNQDSRPKGVGARSVVRSNSDADNGDSSGGDRDQLTEARSRRAPQEGLRTTSTPTPSHASRGIEDATSPRRDPSIAVVIPAQRQSSRLKSQASRRRILQIGISTSVSRTASARSALLLLTMALLMTGPCRLKAYSQERRDGQGKDETVDPARRRQRATVWLW